MENQCDIFVKAHWGTIQQAYNDAQEGERFLSNQKEYDQFIHGDFHPRNVLCVNNKVVLILDFDTLRLGSVFEDAAFAAFRFAKPNMRWSNEDLILQRLNIYYEQYTEEFLMRNKPSLQFLKNIFIYETYRRLSLILRDYYFHGRNDWLFDLPKHVNYLAFACKLNF